MSSDIHTSETATMRAITQSHYGSADVLRLARVPRPVVRDDQVLDIKAEGQSYDGRQFFQSLFSAGQMDAAAEPADPFGVDLTARTAWITATNATGRDTFPVHAHTRRALTTPAAD